MDGLYDQFKISSQRKYGGKVVGFKSKARFEILKSPQSQTKRQKYQDVKRGVNKAVKEA